MRRETSGAPCSAGPGGALVTGAHLPRWGQALPCPAAWFLSVLWLWGQGSAPAYRSPCRTCYLCVSCFSKQLFFFLPALSCGGERRCEAFAAFVQCSACGEDGGCGGGVPFLWSSGGFCQHSCPWSKAAAARGWRGAPGHSQLAQGASAWGERLSCGLAALPCSQTLLPARTRECGSDCRAVPGELLAAVWWQAGCSGAGSPELW